VHNSLLPVLRAFARVGGVSFSKAALRLTGLDAGDARLPQLPPDADTLDAIADDLREAGVPVSTQ
jgi:4-hydroxy-tetrahydrodipicolinate synthase